jgi:hypothetical protein
MQTPELTIMTPEKFMESLDKIVREKNMKYLDAIMYLCETKGLEVETVPRLISPRIKKILTNEAVGLNLLKRKSNEPRLPL